MGESTIASGVRIKRIEVGNGLRELVIGCRMGYSHLDIDRVGHPL